MKSARTTPKLLRGAFTLIELLTVIAIIGILAAILIPTVGAVRDRAKKTQCQSNLRQNYQAIVMYTADNKDMLPGPLNGIQSAFYRLLDTGPSGSMASFIAPYQGLTLDATLRMSPYMRCPAHVLDNPNDDKRSYQIIASSQSNYPFGYTPGTPQPKKFYTYTQSRNPKVFWMLKDVDRLQSIAASNPTVSETQMHKSARNYLFFDGSVRSLTESEEAAILITTTGSS